MTPDRTKYTMWRGGSDAYQSLPYLTPPLLNRLVILVWSTKVYQVADLGLTFWSATFTNCYHRGEGTRSRLTYTGHSGWVVRVGQGYTQLEWLE